MSHHQYKGLLFLTSFLIWLGLDVLPLNASGFLHTQGHDIVDETGRKILLRGVGLGNWLLPEGYMWKFGKEGDRPRKIETLVSDLIGPEKANEFWLAFRANYITEADIQRIAELGFNSVRPALNARRFLTEGDDPVYVEEGFRLLDNLVQWCSQYDLYVIIDMHGAPGGQTGANIDDSANDLPELFMDTKHQDRLVDLWVRIAQRYKDEPAVAAYDLLNEPLPQRTGAADKYKHLVEPLYKRITTAIRKVDKKHMITLEGVDWANDWSIFTGPFDDNVFYQFHYYCWNRPDNLNDISRFIALREKFNTPIWVGETGEKNNTIYWATTQYFEAHNIGWSFWPWKKMDTTNTPYSINPPEGWEQIKAYSQGRDKPPQDLAQKSFDDLLENIKLANCVYYPDVVNAIFRRIPGKVQAENYGHQGPNKSYFVKNTNTHAQQYRTKEPVIIESMEGNEQARDSGQCISLSAGEWTAYNINSLSAGTYQGSMRAKASGLPTNLTITWNGHTQNMVIHEDQWHTITLDKVTAITGANHLMLTVNQGSICCDWFQFEEKSRLYFGLGRFSGKFVIDNIGLSPMTEPVD